MAYALIKAFPPKGAGEENTWATTPILPGRRLWVGVRGHWRHVRLYF